MFRKVYPAETALPSIEIGELVDVYDKQTREWRSGRIQHKAASGQFVSIAVEGPKRGMSKPVAVEVNSENIRPFMQSNVNYSEVHIFNLYHRYQKTDDTYEFFGLPKFLFVGTWASCGQVINEVELQAKQFLQPETRDSFVTPIKPNMSIVRPIGLPLKSVLPLPSNPLMSGGGGPKLPPLIRSQFPKWQKITLIDTKTNICAICSAKEQFDKGSLPSVKARQCHGCNLADNAHLPIKYLLESPLGSS
jgi:hypothetical protein